MFVALHKRLREREEGFTLIELMVVVLIIAILIAIAIPTFLGARERAQNRAAQSDLRNALVASKVWYTDAQTYNVGDTTNAAAAAEYQAIEPALAFEGGLDEGAVRVVGVDANDQAVTFRTVSVSGAVFLIGDIATGDNAGTYYCAEGDGSVCDRLTAGTEGEEPEGPPPAPWTQDGF